MLKYNTLGLLLFALYLYACNSHTKNNSKIENSPLQFYVNDWEIKKTIPTSIINEVKFIPLETTDNNLIGSIDKIIFSEEYIYILDARFRQDILVFDNHGKYLKKIGQVGKGAGEYIRLTDFNINKEKSHIIILDSQVHKLLFYDMSDGTCLKEYKLNFWASNFLIQNELTYLFYSKEQLSKDQHLLVQLNLKNNKCKWFIKKDEYDTNVNTRFSLYQSNNKYFTTYLKDVVYKITENEVVPYARFNFKNEIPGNLLKKVASGNASELLHFIGEKKFSYNINNFLESSDFITFDFKLKMYPTFVVYSKKSGEYKYGNHFESPFDKLRPLKFISTKEDVFITAIDAITYKKVKEKIQNQKNKEMISYKFPEEDNLSRESNPILILMKFKSF